MFNVIITSQSFLFLSDCLKQVKLYYINDFLHNFESNSKNVMVSWKTLITIPCWVQVKIFLLLFLKTFYLQQRGDSLLTTIKPEF